MTTRVHVHEITVCRVHVSSSTTPCQQSILIETMFILNAIKSRFEGLRDKQNLTLVVILYEIYEFCRRIVS